mmetsp:Transcript_8445/g.12514  ORF Transcript_8445/g.12514 Transcript_8445/m.12514 type:complete len:207 (-) Transcript_8445:1309-1929(-)
MIIIFVIFVGIERTKLSCWFCICHLIKHRNIKFIRAIQQHSLQIALVDPTNRVQISATGIVLGKVPPQRLIDVGRSKHQQKAASTANPRQQLRKQICCNHAQPGLNVLKRQILATRAPLGLVIWNFAGRDCKCFQNRTDHQIDVHPQMITANGGCESKRSAVRTGRAIGAAHETSGKDVRCHLLRAGRHESRSLGMGQTLQILCNL